MTVVLRLAEPRDIEDLVAIEHSQFPEPWTKSMLLDEVTNHETRRYTVATDQGRVVGYLGMMFVLDEAHVNTIGVMPGRERQGIATALLDEAWDDLRARGIARATLEVAVSNEPARKLYHRYGFAPVGIRKNYYATINEDALVMWADVAPSTLEP